MKNNIFLITPLFAATLFFSCTPERERKKDEVEITGQLTNGAGKTIVLEELTPEAVVPSDSMVVGEDGSFTIYRVLKEPGFFRLRISRNNFLTMILDTSETVQVTGNADDLQGTYTVSGSPSSNLMKELNGEITKGYARRDSLENIFRKFSSAGNINIDSLRNALMESYMIIMNDLNEAVKKFIGNNPASFTILAAINHLEPDQHFSWYEQVDSSLTKNFPASSYAKAFHDRMTELRILAPGVQAPEISLDNPAGKQVALSSLQGKIVLIDFWASWCAPCRQENPNVKRIYNAYRDKGFEIYGVSLDKDKAAWLNAIKTDGLDWIHVSDLKYWDSAVVPLYRFQGIPYTCLIDKEGKIVAKGLRGKALEDKLKELLDMPR